MYGEALGRKESSLTMPGHTWGGGECQEHCVSYVLRSFRVYAIEFIQRECIGMRKDFDDLIRTPQENSRSFGVLIASGRVVLT